MEASTSTSTEKETSEAKLNFFREKLPPMLTKITIPVVAFAGLTAFVGLRSGALVRHPRYVLSPGFYSRATACIIVPHVVGYKVLVYDQYREKFPPIEDGSLFRRMEKHFKKFVSYFANDRYEPFPYEVISIAERQEILEKSMRNHLFFFCVPGAILGFLFTIGWSKARPKWPPFMFHTFNAFFWGMFNTVLGPMYGLEQIKFTERKRLNDLMKIAPSDQEIIEAEEKMELIANLNKKYELNIG